MTHEDPRPTDAKDTKAHDGNGEDVRVARIAPAAVDFESIVAAPSRLLGEGQERGTSEYDDGVRQTG